MSDTGGEKGVGGLKNGYVNFEKHLQGIEAVVRRCSVKKVLQSNLSIADMLCNRQLVIAETL